MGIVNEYRRKLVDRNHHTIEDFSTGNIHYIRCGLVVARSVIEDFSTNYPPECNKPAWWRWTGAEMEKLP